jgi:hypothetical protein
MSDSEDYTQSQEILVAFWGVLMVVIMVFFGCVMYKHRKSDLQLHKKLYNFKKAPKNYVDDDSFINVNDI